VDRHARKGLAMTSWRVRVGWWFTVDRHGLRPRDDKSDGFPFTLHPSIFALPSLAFLETYTEAYVAVAGTGGAGVAALS